MRSRVQEERANQLKDKKQQAQAKRDLIKSCFASREGQALLENLKAFCGEGLEVIGKDTHDTYYNAGKQSVILHINKLLEEK